MTGSVKKVYGVVWFSVYLAFNTTGVRLTHIKYGAK